MSRGSGSVATATAGRLSRGRRLTVLLPHFSIGRLRAGHFRRSARGYRWIGRPLVRKPPTCDAPGGAGQGSRPGSTPGTGTIPRPGNPVPAGGKARLPPQLQPRGSVPIFLFPSPNPCFDGEVGGESARETQWERGVFSNCLCTLLCLSACSNFRSYGENSNDCEVFMGWSG